jgi:hypothetical protein
MHPALSVLTSFRDAASFNAVIVSGNGVVAEARVEGGSVTFTSLGDVGALDANGTMRIVVTYAPSTASVTINGKTFTRVLGAPPRIGFVVWGSRVRFGDLTYR